MTCAKLLRLSSEPTYSLHCSSFVGLPFGILNIELVKPKKGTTMETIGRNLARRCPTPPDIPVAYTSINGTRNSVPCSNLLIVSIIDKLSA